LTLKGTTELPSVLKSAGLHDRHLRQVAPSATSPTTGRTSAAFDEMFIPRLRWHRDRSSPQLRRLSRNSYFNPTFCDKRESFEKTKGHMHRPFFFARLRWIESVKGKKPFYCYCSPRTLPRLAAGAAPRTRNATPTGEGPERANVFGMIANIGETLGPAAG